MKNCRSAMSRPAPVYGFASDMGVFSRPDSKFWWIYLEKTGSRQATDIVVGHTGTQRQESRKLANDLYHKLANEAAIRIHQIPNAQPAVRFDKYAATYLQDTVPQHRGHEREAEIVKVLVRELGNDLLTSIDQDRVRTYMRIRREKVSARTVNREVGLLKSMIRDAVPKYLAASPLVGMKYLKIVTPKRRLMSEAEEARLLAKADAVEKALIIVAVDGLIRLNDLLDVQRSDRKGEWLYVANPKSGEPYEVVLPARAVKALAAIPGSHRYYFQRYRGATMDRDRRARVRRMLMTLCRKARVPYGKSNGGITFHWATRRTGATRLVVTRKASIPAVQRQGNWKTADVLLGIYTEADRQAQRDAIIKPRAKHA